MKKKNQKIEIISSSSILSIFIFFTGKSASMLVLDSFNLIV